MKKTKIGILLFLFTFLFTLSAYADKARNIQTDGDSLYHASHMAQHYGSRECHCIANYVKIRTNAGSNRVLGHLEQADRFTLLDIEDHWAYITVDESAETSPDSWAGLSGWVNCDYLDCWCSEEEYEGLVKINRGDYPLGSYAEILDMMYTGLTQKWDFDLFDQYWVAAADLTRWSADSVYYQISDINNDGIDELLFLVRDGASYAEEIDYEVQILYTQKNGKPVLLLTGWNRNTYYLTATGSIINIGSNGVYDNAILKYELQNSELHLLEGIHYYEEQDYFVTEQNWMTDFHQPVSADFAASKVAEYESARNYRYNASLLSNWPQSR